MRVHYALVDDLYTIEEFTRLVGEKTEESGGLLDEQTAAILVIREAGRQHIKIGQMPAASSLICFFGKVIEVKEPHEFNRDDGTPGLVSRLKVGDDSGEIPVVLWDERAAAVTEIEIGDVLEIIGRRKSSSYPEVHALNMRKTPCDIATRDEGKTAASGNGRDLVTLEARVLAVGEVRRFTRRDGTAGEMIEVVIGTPEGTARLVCWSPVLFEGVGAGATLRIEGARPNARSAQREYSIGEQATLSPLEREIEVSFTPVEEITDDSVFSVRGRISGIRPPRRFTTKRGDESWVRNGTLEDDTGRINLVLWGDHASSPLMKGDQLEIYHVSAKTGRYGDREIHVGRGSAVRIGPAPPREVTVEGTVIGTAAGRCLDTGTECFLLEGDLPLGMEVRADGLLAGRRFTPLRCETRVPAPGDLWNRLRQFLGEGENGC